MRSVVDPCEVRFEGETPVADRRIPEVLIVRSGDREFGRFKMTATKDGASFEANRDDGGSGGAVPRSDGGQP